MSEPGVQEEGAAASEQAPRTAGALLREARQAQGMHIAALSAAIKVSQKKLELLESDRLSELPDATFTRALAQTVCRALKIDPAPVLALLPAATGHRLEQVGEGINAPFRDRPGRREPGDWGMWASPAVWGPLLIVLGAVLLYLLPSGWLASFEPSSSAPAASAPARSASASVALVTQNLPMKLETPAPAPSEVAVRPATTAASAVAVAPAASIAATAARAAAASDGGALQVHARDGAWLEVRDANAKLLISRLLQPGESVTLDGAAPFKLKVGNAGATEVVFRGQAVDLAPMTRDNVARLELK